MLTIYKKLEERYREQWFIALREKRNYLANKFDQRGFRIISSPKDRFYADPFPIKFGGVNYVFFEDFRLENNKGVISYFIIGKNGNNTPPKTVLIRDYHLSYPFIFIWDNTVYMIPETSQNRTIELYKAIDFPENWQLSKTLFSNVCASDTTIFIYNNKFWLFTNIAVPDSSSLNEKLFLFYADSLYNDWVPHPQNPIVSDLCTARPAGKIFIQDGKIIRPGQDCSIRYGYAISLNQIEVLSETAYREKLINKITPDWLPNNLCTHTINSNEDIEVIDGKMFVKKFIWFDFIAKIFK